MFPKGLPCKRDGKLSFAAGFEWCCDWEVYIMEDLQEEVTFVLGFWRIQFQMVQHGVMQKGVRVRVMDALFGEVECYG